MLRLAFAWYARIHLNTFDGGVSRLHGLNPSVAPIIRFGLPLIAFNHVVPVLNLSVFSVGPDAAFAFKPEQARP